MQSWPFHWHNLWGGFPACNTDPLSRPHWSVWPLLFPLLVTLHYSMQCQSKLFFSSLSQSNSYLHWLLPLTLWSPLIPQLACPLPVHLVTSWVVAVAVNFVYNSMGNGLGSCHNFRLYHFFCFFFLVCFFDCCSVASGLGWFLVCFDMRYSNLT